MNLNILNNRSNYFKNILSTDFYPSIKETLNRQQKIILTIALAIFSSVAIGISYYYLRTKIVTQRDRVPDYRMPPNFYDHLKEPVSQSKDGLAVINQDMWLSIFKFIDLGSWYYLSQINTVFSRLSKHPITYACLLNAKQIPSVKVFEFMKLASPNMLHTLDFTNLTFQSSQELEQVFTTFPKLEDLNLCVSVHSLKLITDKVLEKLPLELKHLKLTPFPSQVREGIKNLPRGLLSLELYVDETTRLEELPPRLISLKLITYSDQFRLLEKLPSSLTSLSVVGFSGIIFELPQNLTSLNLAGCALIYKELKKLLSLLPHLTSFDLRNCGLITEEALVELPAELQSLILKQPGFITNRGIAQLPRGLKSLVLPFSEDITDEGIAHLPPALTSLSWLDGNRITEEGIAKLPLTLTSFQFFSSNQMADQVAEKFIESLPRGLTSLELRMKMIDTQSSVSKRFTSLIKNFIATETETKSLGQFPAGLTSLILNWKDEVTDARIETLPRTLKKLTLYHCQEITSAGIKQLPRGLTYLDLHQSNIQDRDVEHLPRDLTFLHLSGCYITDKGIKKLPLKLKNLFLNNYRQITNIGIKHLPRGLKELSLKNCGKLTDEAIEYLPAGLRVLDLEQTEHITEKGLQSLPIGLTRLYIVGNCSQITNEFIKKLRSKGMRVDIF